jgi:hypothetical protein
MASGAQNISAHGNNTVVFPESHGNVSLGGNSTSEGWDESSHYLSLIAVAGCIFMVLLFAAYAPKGWSSHPTVLSDKEQGGDAYACRKYSGLKVPEFRLEGEEMEVDLASVANLAISGVLDEKALQRALLEQSKRGTEGPATTEPLARKDEDSSAFSVQPPSKAKERMQPAATSPPAADTAAALLKNTDLAAAKAAWANTSSFITSASLKTADRGSVSKKNVRTGGANKASAVKVSTEKVSTERQSTEKESADVKLGVNGVGDSDSNSGFSDEERDVGSGGGSNGDSGFSDDGEDGFGSGDDMDKGQNQQDFFKLDGSDDHHNWHHDGDDDGNDDNDTFAAYIMRTGGGERDAASTAAAAASAAAASSPASSPPATRAAKEPRFSGAGSHMVPVRKAGTERSAITLSTSITRASGRNLYVRAQAVKMVTPKLLPTPRASASRIASRSSGISSIRIPRAHAAAAMGPLGGTDTSTDNSSSDSDDDDWQNTQPPRLVKPNFLAGPKSR